MAYAMETPSFLIIRLSAIGDIILTSPLVRELRAAYPHSKIDYLTKPAFKSLLLHSPYLDSIYTLQDFKPEHYDYVIDFQNNMKSRKLSKGLGKKTFKYYKHNWKKFLLVHFKIDLLSHTLPVAERYKEDLKELEINDDGRGNEIFLSQEDEDFANERLNSNVKTIAVCFGATHFTKRYPTERFVELMDQITAKTDANVMLLGGNDEIDAANKILQTASSKHRIEDFTGKTTLLQSAALLKHADVVVTNDTGLMHMASAFKKPIIAIFGSSVREFGFAPYRTPNTIIEVNGLKCRPCSHIGRKTCPKGHFKCMLKIDARKVSNTVLEYLKA